MSIEAMKQALDALALFASDESDEGQLAIAAHEALRQAIEQAEKQDRNFCERCGKRLGEEGHIHTCTPPSTVRYLPNEGHARVVWVGLTDEEILNLYTGITKSAWDCIMYARVIEERLKGMNHEPKPNKDLCGND
jgi:hypothetical protein